MKPFKSLNILREYRVPRNDIIGEFYIPLLENATNYKRSVGYFSSDALIQLSYGIGKLIENGGKISLIVSPNIQEEDYKAINEGYELRNKIVEKSLVNGLKIYDDYFSKERLNLVTQLIADGKLEIKIAFSVYNGGFGLYHEKLGLIYSSNNEVVAFSGSMNETESGMKINYETIDVYCSWKEAERTEDKIKAFDLLWNDTDEFAKTFDFPEAVKQQLMKYNYKEARYDIDEVEMEYLYEQEKKKKKVPHIPQNIKLRYYQIDAINSWKKNNYVGIFDMATGTGKTITAISAIVELLKFRKMQLGIIICVPYQHLVDQWNEDLSNFGFRTILGYSGSPQKRWKAMLKRYITEYSMSIRDNFCLVITYSSYITKTVQEYIQQSTKPLLLVVDEAHDFGTKRLLNSLNEKVFPYRLALSATFDRYHDEIGTTALYDFFQVKCLTYTLEKAINEGMLTPYYYYPIVVHLNDEELEAYNKLSSEIGKLVIRNKDGTIKLSEKAKMLLIQRSRIIAGANEKIPKLIEVMNKYKDKYFSLVYCGAAKSDYEGKNVDLEDIKQIHAVQYALSHELEMNVAPFTAEEDPEQRQGIINSFKNGDSLQAIVAIKCLDEGVNIPNIQTAFILASSTNPKEYIQRRGRVLRLAPGKDFATIYDFVTLPRDINEITYADDLDYDKSLVRREINRVRDFADLSLNSADSYELIEQLYEVYGNVVYTQLTEENLDEFNI